MLSFEVKILKFKRNLLINFVLSSIPDCLLRVPLIIYYFISTRFEHNIKFLLGWHSSSFLSRLLNISDHLFWVIADIWLISLTKYLFQENLRVNRLVNQCLLGQCDLDPLASPQQTKVSIADFVHWKGYVKIVF